MPKSSAFESPDAAFRAAAAVLTTQLRQDKQNPVLWKQLAKTKFNIWTVTLSEQDLLAAKHSYEKALHFSENADDPAALYQMSRLCIAHGTYEVAMRILEQIAREHPDYGDFPKILLSLAATYRRTQHFQQAIQTFCKLIELGPQYPITQVDIMIQLAWTYEQQGVLARDLQATAEAAQAWRSAYDAVYRKKFGVRLRTGNALLSTIGSFRMEDQAFYSWRESHTLWLRMGSRFADAGYVGIAVSCAASFVFIVMSHLQFCCTGGLL